MWSLLKGFTYTIVSNVISLIVSFLTVLIIPKLLGIEEYGYFQLYLFYSLYVGFLHFGWIDGIYLRYGGVQYNALDKNLFNSQFMMLLFMQFFLLATFSSITFLNVSNHDRAFVFYMISICMILLNLRYMFLYVLQITQRIKEYAQVTIMDRVLFGIIVLSLILLGVKDYKFIVVADLIGKLISLLYATYCCKEIVFRKTKILRSHVCEVIENVKIGIKLMFATIAGILILGVVRYGIEKSWDVSTFGKVSLTLSLSNLLLTFINSVSIVLFPMLKRTSSEKLSNIYLSLRTLLMVILLGMLSFYFPIKLIMSDWLPKYADSLKYMALLFPMCVFEGKMALLINTYFKTMRKEKVMLQINSVTLLLSVIGTVVSVVSLRNLNLTVLLITIVIAFKSTVSELILSKSLRISIRKSIATELVLISIFILTAWYLNSWYSFLIYTAFFIIYVIIKRSDILLVFKKIRMVRRAQS